MTIYGSQAKFGHRLFLYSLQTEEDISLGMSLSWIDLIKGINLEAFPPYFVLWDQLLVDFTSSVGPDTDSRFTVIEVMALNSVGFNHLVE